MLKFVYVKTLKGVTPELWHNPPTTGAGVAKVAPLQSTDLPDTFADIPLDTLATLYPYTGAPTNE